MRVFSYVHTCLFISILGSISAFKTGKYMKRVQYAAKAVFGTIVTVQSSSTELPETTTRFMRLLITIRLYLCKLE